MSGERTTLPEPFRCWCGEVRLAGRPYCEKHKSSAPQAMEDRVDELETRIAVLEERYARANAAAERERCALLTEEVAANAPNARNVLLILADLIRSGEDAE